MSYRTFHDYEDEGMQDSMLRRIQWVSPDEREEINAEVRKLNRLTCVCFVTAIIVVVLVIIFV